MGASVNTRRNEMNRFRWIVAGIAIACLFGITGCSLTEMQEASGISLRAFTHIDRPPGGIPTEFTMEE